MQVLKPWSRTLSHRSLSDPGGGAWHPVRARLWWKTPLNPRYWAGWVGSFCCNDGDERVLEVSIWVCLLSLSWAPHPNSFFCLSTDMVWELYYRLRKCLDVVLALITEASKTSVPGSSRFQRTELKFLCSARTAFSRQVSVPLWATDVFKVQSWEDEGCSRVAIGSPLASLPPSHLF